MTQTIPIEVVTNVHGVAWAGWLGEGEIESAFKKGAPYPWREGRCESYCKKLRELLLAACPTYRSIV